MELATCVFACRLESDTFLPVFKGSVLRGAFGRALRGTVCALRRQNCDDCLLRPQCLYSRIFETGAGAQATIVSQSRPPHPYVLQPPEDPRTFLPAGEVFSFGMRFFGPNSVDWLPYVVCAVTQMGRDGIGSRRQDGAGRFHIETVACNGVVVFSGAAGILSKPPQGVLSLAGMPERPVSRLALSFVTPFRVKDENRLSTRLSFETLVRAALRRMSSLEAAYGDGEPDLDYRGMLERARYVDSEDENLVWKEIERYSSRQRTTMRFGGIAGTVGYRGDLTEFFPVLDYCRQTQIGQRTTFGLGIFDFSAENDT